MVPIFVQERTRKVRKNTTNTPAKHRPSRCAFLTVDSLVPLVIVSFTLIQPGSFVAFDVVPILRPIIEKSVAAVDRLVAVGKAIQVALFVAVLCLDGKDDGQRDKETAAKDDAKKLVAVFVVVELGSDGLSGGSGRMAVGLVADSLHFGCLVVFQIEFKMPPLAQLQIY